MRICTQCQKPHNMVVQDLITGDILRECDFCKDCLFRGCQVKIDLDATSVELKEFDPILSPNWRMKLFPNEEKK